MPPETYDKRTRGELGNVDTNHVHEAVHKGKMFTSEAEFRSLGTGNFFHTIVKTGATVPHMFWAIDADSSIIMSIFESSSCTTSSDYTIFNSNRTSVNTTNTTFHEVATIVTSGIVIRKIEARTKQNAGANNRSNQEIELAPNSLYRFAIESRGASNDGLVSILFYEE